jgi:hypothetical protein
MACAILTCAAPRFAGFEAWASERGAGLGMERLSPVRIPGGRSGGDRVGVDGEGPGTKADRRGENVSQPRLAPNTGREPGAPGSFEDAQWNHFLGQVSSFCKAGG